MFRFFKRLKILYNRGWYKNLEGKLVHPHLLNIISLSELYFMTNQEFEKL